MLTSKQRSFLRSLSNGIVPIFQVGKGGIEENFIKQIDGALETRELIKIAVLNNSDYTARDASNEICESLNCDGVSCVGRKFVLYRKSKDNPRIELPK